LVQWNDYKMDAQMGGTILVIRNEDRPGVIGAIGTLLGQAGINVSRMQVGLADDGRDAASLWALDKALEAALLDQIRSNSAVKHAYCVTMA
jgi:D-3-phosphoglycerate dehydrogenase